MGASPHANGGILLRDLSMPDFRDYAVDAPAPGTRGIGVIFRHIGAKEFSAYRSQRVSGI
jgi:xylulose-5-phosphate/fructose-6-phosphate phosphoketolase